MQWEQKLARQSTMEDPCESVLIRVPLFLCALCASAVKNPFQAAKDFYVSSTDRATARAKPMRWQLVVSAWISENLCPECGFRRKNINSHSCV